MYDPDLTVGNCYTRLGERWSKKMINVAGKGGGFVMSSRGFHK
jgi:hypothetical protein